MAKDKLNWRGGEGKGEKRGREGGNVKDKGQRQGDKDNVQVEVKGHGENKEERQG